MLQIIGWLGCAMLAVKLLEMQANASLRQDGGEMRPSAMVALFAGWIAVLGFAFWLYAQGSAFPDAAQALSEPDNQLACLDAATTVEEIAACSG